MRRLTTILFVAVVAVGLHATAQGLGEIKQRMQKRRASITVLKTAKAVGEDSNGYLHILGDVTAKDKAVVEAENADRKLVYAAVAAKTGITAEAVGKSRAKKIAKSTAPGVMVQAPDGTWYQKK
ncbi:MAG: YdbL family protein [Victivallales bacterium]|nr:YdbL family protein [Victivallales bacterium]